MWEEASKGGIIMNTENTHKRRRLKQPISKAKDQARAYFDRHALSVALAFLFILILALMAVGFFIGTKVGGKDANGRANQAEKRLNELKDDHAAEITRLQSEAEAETERKVEEAKAQARLEIIPQISTLVDKLGEEIAAYKMLSDEIDKLLDMCENMVDNVYKDQGEVEIQGTVTASTAFCLEPTSYFPRGLQPLIDIYMGWKELYPEGYANLVRWGKAYAEGDTTNQPSLVIDPAMKEACRLAWEAERWEGMKDKVRAYVRAMGFKSISDADIDWACQLAIDHNYDPRLWAIIAMAESPLPPRQGVNIFGFIGSWAGPTGSWREQIQYFDYMIMTKYSKAVDISNPAHILFFHHEGDPVTGDPCRIDYVRRCMSWLNGIGR